MRRLRASGEELIPEPQDQLQWQLLGRATYYLTPSENSRGADQLEALKHWLLGRELLQQGWMD